MSDITRSKKNVINKTAKKKGRFGGGPVQLYSDPLHAFRAHGAVVSSYKINTDGSLSWDVTCPFHNDPVTAATLTHRNDGKWQFTCRAFNCGNRPGENKLEMLSNSLSLVVSDFTPESNQAILNLAEDFWRN